jgi:hypothetical protein
MDLLDIPATLTTRPKGSVDLRLAFAKYLEFGRARAQMFEMYNDGSWPIREPTSHEFIEVFVSNSVWHDNYKKFFPRAMKVPLLLKWLKNEKDESTGELVRGVTIFGVEKVSYGFKDLKRYLATLDDDVEMEEEEDEEEDEDEDEEEKGKGKAKAKGKGKGKGKGKEKEKENGKEDNGLKKKRKAKGSISEGSSKKKGKKASISEDSSS